MNWPALPASPTRFAAVLLRLTWRRWRCGHPGWTPPDGPCRGCGKETR